MLIKPYASNIHKSIFLKYKNMTCMSIFVITCNYMSINYIIKGIKKKPPERVVFFYFFNKILRFLALSIA